MAETDILSVVERRAEDKQKLLDALREMPIIQIACKKAGVSRPTYYRWEREDKLFKRQAKDALDQGVEFINDMSESQLITLIKEKKIPAIALWLKHRHPSYGSKVKNYTPMVEPEDLTPEEQQIVVDALQMASGNIRNKTYGKNRSAIRRKHAQQPEDSTTPRL